MWRVGMVAIGEVAEASEGVEGLAVEDVVEILLSLPLMVKNAVAGAVELQFCDALPTICFPFTGAINTHILLNAIATVLSLTVSFQTCFVGRIVFHDQK